MWLELVIFLFFIFKECIVKWKLNVICDFFFKVVCKMVEEDGVKVFYVRGNYDYEMMVGVVVQFMGKEVEFVEGILIYVINSDDGQQYRIWFVYGYDWDFFNIYFLIDLNDFLGGRFIGYYVIRVVVIIEVVMIEIEEVGVYDCVN